MSVTVSDCNQICNSPLNRSTAKMLYSFSKEERFKTTNKVLCDKFYNVPTSQEKRTTGFGYGTKFDFTKTLPNTPPPNAYKIKSYCEEAKDHNVGFGFGEGRGEMQCTGPLSNISTNKNPGPGAYEVPSTLSKSAYSFRDRTKIESDEPKKVPGPGSYPVTFTLNKTGQYFLSRYRNSCAALFNPRKSERFRYVSNKVPGPGAYDHSQTTLSSEGRYFLSRLKGSQVRSFPHENRKTMSALSTNPGPGNYKLPSEFGHYVSKDWAERSKQQTEDKENKQ